MIRCQFLTLLLFASISWPALAADPESVTSLANPAVKFTVPAKPYIILKRGGIEAVIVDNSAVDDAVLPAHKSGYSGVASLKHTKRKENLFVPAYAGLNFEHIHDGTVQDRSVLFEPRFAPMEVRVINEHAAELYQKPSPHWGLESCQRYELLEDGTIQVTIECIPRKKSFKHNYIGLFWASYIDKPESMDIHFKGTHARPRALREIWVRGVTPTHGELATHLALGDKREYPHDETFPLSLVFGMSELNYMQPWYLGVSHDMALAQMFRPQDEVRLSQSPSGGGAGNPAWDFQFLIDDYKVDQLYRYVMRAAYLPYESNEQIEKATQKNREALAAEK